MYIISICMLYMSICVYYVYIISIYIMYICIYHKYMCIYHKYILCIYVYIIYIYIRHNWKISKGISKAIHTSNLIGYIILGKYMLQSCFSRNAVHH